MKGYKGMDKDMKCRGMQYEIGKTYHVDGNIKLCQNGLHFCEKLKDVMNYYDRNDNSRYFEIEAKEPVESDGKKSVTAELTVVRELTDIEVNKTVYGNGYGYGNGDSYGDGFGYGDGNGDGYGDGNGYGYGNGNSYGDGYCYGDSYGENIQKLLVFND